MKNKSYTVREAIWVALIVVLPPTFVALLSSQTMEFSEKKEIVVMTCYYTLSILLAVLYFWCYFKRPQKIIIDETGIQYFHRFFISQKSFFIEWGDIKRIYYDWYEDRSPGFSRSLTIEKNSGEELPIPLRELRYNPKKLRQTITDFSPDKNIFDREQTRLNHRHIYKILRFDIICISITVLIIILLLKCE